MRLSYAKFLHLLEKNRIKRIIVYGDMRTAVVEVPHPWSASISGAPGSYPFYEDDQGRPLSLMVQNPEAPDDPRWGDLAFGTA
jgi:cell division protease FtsH